MIGVGSLVVCLVDYEHTKNNQLFWYNNVPNKPIKGLIYTVREFAPPYYDNILKVNLQGIYLEEILNAPVNWGVYGIVEGNFNILEFAPVKRPSIETIRELLIKPPSPELLEEYEKV